MRRLQLLDSEPAASAHSGVSAGVCVSGWARASTRTVMTLALPLLAALTGCGQKGPLALPTASGSATPVASSGPSGPRSAPAAPGASAPTIGVGARP